MADRFQMDAQGPYRRPEPEPAFNVPGVVLVVLAVLVLVHAGRTYVLASAFDIQALLDFSFVPGCYETSGDICAFRNGWADVWSPLTHALLHGDWMHLATNALWLLAFGTPVARRIGAVRFVLFIASGAIAGAGLFFVLNPHLLQPMIGASGAVSALMGGASRFALGRGGGAFNERAAGLRRLTIGQALRDRTILFFILIFFATNIALGSGLGAAFGGVSIAWEAHLGGFLLGFLAFGLFDPAGRAPIAPRG